jgi:4,5-DOPA dioxygenase extradiol
MSALLPALFLGHGNPMNAVSENPWTRAWAALGTALPRPRAVLAISAHWYLPATAVTAMAAPRTIHDFGGFPRELFEVRYPAPGDTQLAGRVQELLAPLSVSADQSWGLDHGTWSVLRHVFPQADVPVVQLSIDETQPAAFHYGLWRTAAASARGRSAAHGQRGRGAQPARLRLGQEGAGALRLGTAF